MDNESGQMADSGGQHPQSMTCVDATGAMSRSDMAGDDDGETVADSEERPQDQDEAKLVHQRAQQKRRFTAARTSLIREFGKDNPSLRYLKKGLCEAEEILGHTEAIVISQRQLLERQNNISRLAVLVDWESKLKNECELLAEVSSLLENAPSEHQLRAIIEHPKILNERDVDGLTKFAITLRSILANMTTCGMQPGVELCLMATEKVPKSMLVRYFERHGDGNTDVVQFSEWLIDGLKTLKRANDRASTAGSAPQPTQKPHKTRTLVGSTTPAPQCDASSSASNSSNAYGGRKFNATNNNKCRKCLGPHSLANCRSFKELPVAKRVEFVRLLGVCNNCLREGHWAKKRSATTCAKCSRSHHTLLHLAKSEESSSQGAPAQHGPETQNKSSNTAHGVVSDNVSFMTVPVQVTSGDKRVQVTAILDSGSSCTYVSQEVANALNLESPLTTLETSVLVFWKES